MAFGNQVMNSDTLLIRHLPKEFTLEEKAEFLQHFGAVDVNSLGDNVKSDLVFARFQSAAAAKAALSRLHQLEVLGRRLNVVFAHNDQLRSSNPSTQTHHKKFDSKPEEDKRQQLQDALMRRLVAWSSSLNLSQPPPSHLRYQYPPPSPGTLANISRALATYPRLYTQLLHLMNRMNLPPPFQDTNQSQTTSSQSTQTDEVWRQQSSSESEFESDDELPKVASDVLPLKRTLHNKSHHPLKRPKFIKPMKPPISDSVATSTPVLRPEEIFEKIDTPTPPKKIELHLSANIPVEGGVSKTNIVSQPLDVGGFGVLLPTNKATDDREDKEKGDKDESASVEDGSVITEDQLASNRIRAKDLKTLPVFKNYVPGTPSCRLYVKNVSKHAVARDLHFIYRRYLPSAKELDSDIQTSMFDVRLMTEGRMKGQAFITLPSVQIAQQALTETNGYILKDKPLVVQFARSAPASAGSAAS